MHTTTNNSLASTRTPFSISWGAIFAGTAFALGAAWVMYLLGGAIGLTVINPYAQDPTGGLAYGTAVWVLLTWIITLFLGGLLAGRLSDTADRTSGVIHGAMVWSMSIILTISLGIVGITTLLQSGTQLASNVATTGSVMSLASSNNKNSSSIDSTPQGINTLALESELKQQLSQLATNSTQGQASNANAIQQSVNQLNNDQLIKIAGYLLQGKNDAAKNELALNTNLSTSDINNIIDNLNDKVQQYKQNIKDYADKVTDYTAAVLWVVLISTLISLLAAIIGGWIGIHTVSRVYGKTLS